MFDSVPLKTTPKKAAEEAVNKARELGYIPSLKRLRKNDAYEVVCRKPQNLWQHFWFRVLAFVRH
jgi:hypothetical protein